MAGLARASGGNVTTFHNDAASTGQYLSEPLLSATNVNSTNFGKLFSYSADGQVYTQPLYVANVAITTGSYSGTTHNVVYVATQNDSVYAFDADYNAGAGPLWQVNFLDAANNVTTVPSGDVDSTDINPQIGITGTPVIDLAANTLFVCAKTKEVIAGNNHYIFRLHVLDLGSGAEKPGSPVVIADTITNDLATYTFVSGPTVSGTGDGSVSGQVTFNALRQNQRPALVLVNGVVYVAFASHGDIAPYHGWILGYSATNYQLVAAWNANPNGADTGIWQSGGCLASDSNGDLYFMTGNGTFIQPTYDSPSDSYINGSYGDSFVHLTVDTVCDSSTNQNSNGWGLKVASYFTPYNQAALSGADQDLGAGAVMLLPDSAGSVAHPHLIVGGGKAGTLYMADRDNMGGYNDSIDPVVEEQIKAINSFFSTPGYFNGVIYVTPGTGNGNAKSFPIGSGSFSAASAVTPDTFGFPGASPCFSGTSATDPNAIVWCLDGGNGSNQLRAYTASNFSNEIYTSAQAANNRDATGGTCKFAPPTIANTRVYVPTSSGLIAYGLFNAPPTVVPAAPSNLIADALTPNTIWLSWDSNSDNSYGYYIEQSTDGVNYTQVGASGSASTFYPATGLTSGSTYFFRVSAYNNIGASTYSGTAGATALSSAVTVDFSTGFTSSGTAMALNTNGVDSIPAGTPQLQLTSATNGEAHSAWDLTPINASKFNTQFDFQLPANNSTADGFTFAIQRSGTNALGGTGASYGFGGISNGFAINFGLYGGSYTGIYNSGTTIDVMSAASIDFHSGDMMRVNLNYDGTTLFQTITDLNTNDVFSQSYTVNIPAIIGADTGYAGFTGATGGFNSIQTILNWVYTFIPSLPAAPTNLGVTPFSSTVLSLNWTDNATNETGYYIEQSTDDTNFSVTGTVGEGVSTANISGLQPGATYYYRVRAYNTVGTSGYTNIASGATYGGAATIDYSNGFSTSGTTMDFNTNGTGSVPAGTQQLQLISATNGEAHSAWFLQPVNVAAFTTTFDFQVTGASPLADGFTFAIQRSGTNALGGTGGSYGFGGISNGVAVDFGLYGGSYTGLYGGTVYNLAANSISYGSGDVMRVNLTYNGATLTETITDETTKAVFTQNYTINIPATVGGTTAYVGFTGATGGYNSNQSILDWVYTGLPLPPTNLAAAPSTDTEVALNWTNSAADDFGYEIDRANDSAFTVNETVLAGPAITGSAGSYTDSGLTGDTTYYYRIRATNAAGDSSYSGTASALTYCGAPGSPAAVGGNGSVSIAWNSSAGAVSYNLYRSLVSGSEGLIPYLGNLTATTCTDSAVTNGSNYYYTVAAVNASGPGPESAQFTALPSAMLTYNQWQLAEFGSVQATGSAYALETASPAGDGITNLMKYALDLNPYVSGAAGLPVTNVESVSGTNYLTLTFTAPNPPPGDITYNVETTTNLPGNVWSPGVMVTGYPIDNGNGTETVKERSSLPAVYTSEFIRLMVTGP
ncbi:MAG TPA: fibronectin type III domain-containing protein [Chthoniobacteraceae bacterium]|jgi:hypothetical protein|nr:fibronectin type III domain-containing protein [Chthoniobacteraceae bacterium]